MDRAVWAFFFLVILMVSTFPPTSMQSANAQTSNTCVAQPLTISASGSEPANPPQNAIDNNLNTRWSNFGPSWIQVYAGSGKVICSVDIAWYRGNFRQIDFVISVWNSPICRNG